MVTAALSLTRVEVAASSRLSGTKNSGSSLGVAAPPFRAACPAFVRAEARVSSFSVRAARSCQTGVRRTSGRICVHTFAPSIGENFVELTRTEYQLLEVLMLNPRMVLPHSTIYERVWGYDFGPSSNALRVYVGYLRRKLEASGEPRIVQTVRGVGYALREP